MNRVTLTNGRGIWFDLDKALKYEEDTYHDGHNSISVNTKQQFEHQELYKTKTGKFFLAMWSDWQGSGPTQYYEIDKVNAHSWLLRNNHGEEVPAEILSNLEI